MKRNGAEAQLLREVADASPDLILVLRQGGIIYANAASATILGLPGPEDLLGRPLGSLLAPSLAGRVEAALRRVEEGSCRLVTVLELLGPHGHPVPLEATLVPQALQGGRTVFLFGRALARPEQVEAHLRESEEKYRALVEHSPDMILRSDPQGRLVFINTVGERFLGRSLAELQGLTAKEMGISQELVEQWMLGLRSVVETGQPYRTEMALHTPQEQVIVDLRLLPEFDHQGKVASVLGVGRDITQQKKAERAMLLAKHTIDHCPAAIFWVDQGGRITEANEAGCISLGYTREELLRLQVHDLDVSIVPGRWSEVFDRLRRKGSTTFETRHRRKNGTTFPVEITCGLVGLEGWAFVFAIVTDITGRKMEERRQRESQLRLQLSLDAAGAGTWFWRSGQVVWDGAMEGIFGLEPGTFGGTFADWARLLHPEDAPLLTEEGLQGLNGKNRYEVQCRFQKGGEWRTASIKAVTIPDDPYVRVVGITTDITEQRRTEEAILSSQHQLRALATQLSVVEERERRQFATYLHDEVGQSLAVMQIKLGALAVKVREAEAVQMIREIRSMLEATLDSAHSLTFDVSPPILYELGLEPAIEWIGEKVCSDHGLRFIFQDDGEPKPLETDIAPFLFRATRELLINVVKHARATSVLASIRRVDQRVRIVVQDDGVGIVPPLLENRMGESGFGLFSIRERMDYINGAMHFESSPSLGTRVTLEAPLDCAPGERDSH